MNAEISMTEGSDSEITTAPAPLEDNSAGQMLRQAREAYGVDVTAVANALKVSAQRIKALEANDFGALPDRVFARSLAARVCRLLRIDSAPVLAKMPEIPYAGRLGQVGLPQTNVALRGQVFHSILRRTSDQVGNLGSHRMLALIAVFLLAIGLLLWLPQSVFDSIGNRVSQMFASDSAQKQEKKGKQGLKKPAAAASALPSVPSSAAVPVAVADASGTNTNTVQPEQPAAPPAVTPPAQPSAGAASGLVITAREVSWVSVFDASGNPLLRRNLKADETVRVSGALPLTVVLGRASVVSVQFNGKLIDLAPLTREDGVARVKIEP